MQRTPELEGAIADLYRVFAAYPMTRPFLGCPCCHKEGHNLVLESKPMRALTQDDLNRYAGDAITTWGDEPDFKHFLPRIFELLPESNGTHFPDVEIVLHKLNYTNWEQWPEHERDSVRRYLRALWRAAIDTIDGDEHYLDSRIDTWLCGIAQAENDLAPYLVDWIKNPSPTAMRNLVYFILDEVDFIKRQVANAFMEKRKDQSDQIYAWITSPDVLEALRAFHQHDDRTQAQLELAISVLA